MYASELVGRLLIGQSCDYHSVFRVQCAYYLVRVHVLGSN